MCHDQDANALEVPVRWRSSQLELAGRWRLLLVLVITIAANAEMINTPVVQLDFKLSSDAEPLRVNNLAEPLSIIIPMATEVKIEVFVV